MAAAGLAHRPKLLHLAHHIRRPACARRSRPALRATSSTASDAGCGANPLVAPDDAGDWIHRRGISRRRRREHRSGPPTDRPVAAVHTHSWPGPIRSRGAGLSVQPLEAVAGVRRELRAVIGEVWGPGNVPEPADDFRPHVTLGYSNGPGPAEPIGAALAQYDTDLTCQVDVTAVSLIELNRDQRLYVWNDVASAPLG